MHCGCQSSVVKKMAISFRELMIELGLTLQPFQELFERYKNWVTWSWIVSLWEKCSLYAVRIDIGTLDCHFLGSEIVG